MNVNLSRNHRHAVFRSCVVAAIWALSPCLYAQGMQVGRYSLVHVQPSAAQLDPLSARITTRFPEPLHTVGEAVRHLLHNSGYRLADASTPLAAVMLGRPLPDVHRDLGPLTLRQALGVLAGPVFRLVQDPVHRLVAFELCTPHNPGDRP